MLHLITCHGRMMPLLAELLLASVTLQKDVYTCVTGKEVGRVSSNNGRRLRGFEGINGIFVNFSVLESK